MPAPYSNIGAINGSFEPLRMDGEGQPAGAGWKYSYEHPGNDDGQRCFITASRPN